MPRKGPAGPEPQHGLPHLGGEVTAEFHVAALKAFSEGASQGR